MKDFLEFVAGIFRVKSSDINENTKYGTIKAWDSLMQVRLVAEIEDKYNVEIPFDEIEEIKTLKDFYKYVEGK